MIRKILKLVGWTAGIIAVLFLAAIAINAFDEDLSPQAQALIAEPKPVLKDNENAYYAVWGMGAAEGADVQAVGRKVAALLREKYSGPTTPAGADLEGEIGKLKVSPEVGKLCNWSKDDCYAKFAAAADRAPVLAAEHKVLLERYAALGGYKGLEDVGPRTFIAPLPPFQLMTSMATVELANAIADAKRGDVPAGLKRIEGGIALWRPVLASGNILVTKMLAANVLHRHAIVLARLAIDHPEAVAAERERIAVWLAPLSDAERALGVAMQTEFSGMHMFIAQVRRDPRALYAMGEVPSELEGWLKSRFVMPNASSNLLAEGFAQAQAIMVLPADKLLAELPAYHRKIEEHGRLGQEFSLRNPEGRRLASNIGVVGYDLYMQRLHDLDQHLRLAALVVEIRARKLEPDAIAAFVAGAGAAHRDPYTGKPFEWDAAKRVLSAAPQSKGQSNAREGRFAYTL